VPQIAAFLKLVYPILVPIGCSIHGSSRLEYENFVASEKGAPSGNPARFLDTLQTSATAAFEQQTGCYP
jgi:hypothetical protein